MAFDSWGVMPGLKEGEFILAFRDLAAGQGEPFMSTSKPMSEAEIRAELKKMKISDPQADLAIERAENGRKRK
ncbi:MAG TPA: hypothetical protein VEG68_07110 [Terriglobales bacterium]|nr:hypothetical protein [Terriglobales bacterium]